MNEWAIRTEKLGKEYKIGSLQGGYKTIRESAVQVARLAARRLRQDAAAAKSPGTFWALRDVSFEIKQGEVVGIIGRNGAGKSTLLKILSRITGPTEGLAEIRGRVGSLLEVGTGFHPELTGRENIFLNGAILGMGRSEIERKFDEIVDFAEVETFIDTPVKRYSSGMYLRLAFAVAAHLEPEILLVDEVLAVGDAAFQKKCLGRMENVAEEGRTVLFVSHNMGAIRSLCNKGIFLDNGRIVEEGNLSNCITRYFRSVGALADADATSVGQAKEGFGRVHLPQSETNTAAQDEPLVPATTLRIAQQVQGFNLYCLLEDMHGRQIIHLRVGSTELGLDGDLRGEHEIQVSLPPLWLNPGLYSIQFKVLFWGGKGSSRYTSDKFPLDIGGISSMADTVIHPAAQWKVTPATAKPALIE